MTSVGAEDPRSTMDRSALTRLEELPNIGPAIAARLRRIGIRVPSDLIARDPYALFDELEDRTGERHDPCVLDVFISAVRFVEGESPKPWWTYTPERKAAREIDASTVRDPDVRP